MSGTVQKVSCARYFLNSNQVAGAGEYSLKHLLLSHITQPIETIRTVRLGVLILNTGRTSEDNVASAPRNVEFSLTWREPSLPASPKISFLVHGVYVPTI